MGKMDGKVVFITGAARGQGRSHALLLAEEGADIIGMDLCAQVPSVVYEMSTPEDLDETVALVEKTGRRMVAMRGDVRRRGDIKQALDAGLEAFGRVDVVLANAGVMAHQLKPFPMSEQAWQDSLDIMLTGVWHTLQVSVPVMIEAGVGGAIVVTSSSVGLRNVTTNFDGGNDGYNAAKFALVGLMRGYAGRLAQHSIRVNSVHPTGVASPMVVNDFFPRWANENPEVIEAFQNALPVPMIEMIDVSRAILYLVSDDGRYVTGQTLAIDCGQTTVPPSGAVGTPVGG